MYIGGVFALYSAVETNLIHIVAKHYDERNKSIFLVRRNEAKSLEEEQESEAMA